MEWRDSGRSTSGELFEKKKTIKKEATKLMSKDQLQSELVNEEFIERAKSRFRTPCKGKPSGFKLLLKLISTSQRTSYLIPTHFEYLSKSRVSES